MKHVAGIAAALAVVGCAQMAQPIAEEAAGVIVEYCEREPYAVRTVYRNTINAELPAGHMVFVECPGDPNDADAIALGDINDG